MGKPFLVKKWLSARVGIVRVRQIIEEITHRLAFVPIALMLVGLLLSQITLAADRAIGDAEMPEVLSTTAESARAIFGAIAGGLITAVTLLLSMMLVAVQLASRQFSPRTLRNWLGDRTLRRSIGIVLGTTVYALMGLRTVRDDDPVLVPNVTVLTGVLLAIVSLVVMIRAVDHVTRNLQVGTVAQRLVDATIGTIDASDGSRVNERPIETPQASGSAGRPPNGASPDDAVVIEARTSGWVQQIDEQGILDALPDRVEAWILVVHGSYVTTRAPLARARHPDGDDLDDEVVAEIVRSFALGPNRTMQQDVGFGLQQLTDIAVRALSPGVNDPQTAKDITVHLGEVLREIWSYPRADDVMWSGDRSLHRLAPSHQEHLRAALDPIRHHGCSDPSIQTLIARTLRHLRSEVERLELPGPVEPIDEFLGDVLAGAEDDHWLERELEELRTVVLGELDATAHRA